MLEKLAAVERRFEELEALLRDSAASADARAYARLAKERADLAEVVAGYREWSRLHEQIEEGRTLLEDEDAGIRDLAKAELPALRGRLEELEAELKRLLLPRDPNDDRSVILEIRAGTGGDEASLFAADLYRMYGRYAERRGWTVDLLSTSESGSGGFKEVIAEVAGDGAYSRLKFESGVHHVQRVPVTEASGRMSDTGTSGSARPTAAWTAGTRPWRSPAALITSAFGL